jgi:flagellar FliL protein
VYYAIEPPLVVNFEDGSVVRFLQITMEIMAHDQKAIDSVQKNIPLIRNNLLLLMSNRNYQSMMSREGKEKLRQEALTEVRAVQKKEGSPDVDDLLFTTFVVQ